MKPGEARWLPEDRAKAIAYSIESGLRCHMCGTSEWQWEEDLGAFEAIAKICLGCQRKDWQREENSELSQQAGVSLHLVSRAEAKRIRETPNRVPNRRRRRED